MKANRKSLEPRLDFNYWATAYTEYPLQMHCDIGMLRQFAPRKHWIIEIDKATGGCSFGSIGFVAGFTMILTAIGKNISATAKSPGCPIARGEEPTRRIADGYTCI